MFKYLLIFVIIHAVCSAKLPPAKKNSKISSNSTVELSNRLGYTYVQEPVANNYSKRKIITTRIGNNGDPQEQCECVQFYQCDKENVYHADSKDDTITVDCGSQLLTCCITPLQSLSVEQSAYSVSPVTAPTNTNENSSNNSCKCVNIDQCPDYEQYGGGILIPKISTNCPSSQVCCSIARTLPGTTWQPTSSDLPTELPPTDSPMTYECVPFDWCSNRSLNSNYGGNLLLQKVNNLCPVTEINCPTMDIVIPIERTNNSTRDFSECGIRNVDNSFDVRITGSDDATVTKFGEFPWMALILKVNGNDPFVCGASLLSAKVILTAAHCVDGLSPDSIFVRVGEYDTNGSPASELAPHQDRSVSEIIIHPFYRKYVLFNDVALLIVTEPFTFTTNVGPICAPLVNSTFWDITNFDYNNCIATGWGKPSFDSNAAFQNTLRKIDLKIVPPSECEQQLKKSKLGAKFLLHSSFICALGNEGKDTCQGDGGGPLICSVKNNPNRYVQVGVVSWGIECANNFPGVYASIHSVAEWLTSQFNIYNEFNLYPKIRV